MQLFDYAQRRKGSRPGRSKLPAVCGHIRSYQRGCRCEDCKAVSKVYTRASQEVRHQMLTSLPQEFKSPLQLLKESWK